MKRNLLLIGVLLIIALIGKGQTGKPTGKLHSGLKEFNKNLSLVSPTPVTIDGFTMQSPEMVFNSDRTKVLVKLIAKTSLEQLVAELEANGIKVESAVAGLAGAFLTPSELGKLEQIANLQYATPSYKPRHRLSGVIGQGDAALKADIARTTYSVNGAGVKVGVLSDSYNYLGGAPAGVTAGELPGPGNPDGFTTPVQVLADIPSPEVGIDEGRAMIEIVHDVAPGAQKAFATAYPDEAGFAANITALKNAGCNVIVDDIIYYAEPMFQDGIVAQAVNAVKAAGVSYFSSEGNNLNESFEVTYRPGTVTPASPVFGGVPITAHNFAAPGDPDKFFIPIRIVDGAVFSFQWNNPFKSVSPGSTGATSDLDIHFFTGPTGTGYIGSAFDANIGADAVELTGFNGTGTIYMLIQRFDVGVNAEPGSGADPTLLKMVVFGGTYPQTPFPAQSPAFAGNYAAGTGYGHANATGAMGVGAVRFTQTPVFGVTPPVIEYFSSRGGVPILFDLAGDALGAPELRNKPDLSAPDGGNTSFFYSDSGIDADALPNFFGTSAAAPYAAAVAALMIQSRNGNAFTPDQLKTVMLNSCIDMDDPDLPGFQTGFDFRTGSGLLQADLAIAKSVCNTPVFTFTETSGLANNDGTICSGASVTITASGGETYLWNTTATTSSITVSPNMNTTYTVSVNGCSPATVSVTVNPTPTSALIASKTDVCPNTEVTLNAQCSVPTSTVQWNPGAPTVTPNAPNVAYIYKATCTAIGCTGNESSVEVRTQRLLVDLKNVGTGVQPKAIAGAVADNLAPTNAISTPTSPRLWTILASGCSASESAVFKLTGPVNFSSIDNNPPYAIFANVGTDYFAIDHPNYGSGSAGFPNGTYTLTVDLRGADGVGGPFPKNRVATGALLATRTLQFTLGTSTRQGVEEALAVSPTELTEEAWLSVGQNPVNTEVLVRLSGKVGQQIDLSLTNLQGQTIQQRSVVLNSVQQYEVLNVAQAASGMYILKGLKAGEAKTLKVVKMP
ncbi:MAG: S8 family serine peptidase [Spirosomataceae bacterium]